MSAGRVTIMCTAHGYDCRKPATTVNSYKAKNPTKPGTITGCDKCICKPGDAPGEFEWDYNAPLVNPGTATDSDIANVRAAIEAIARLCRALWRDDAESREDRDVLELCAQEVRGEWYERCDAPSCIGGAVLTSRSVHSTETCAVCNGSGLVLRRDRRAQSLEVHAAKSEAFGR